MQKLKEFDRLHKHYMSLLSAIKNHNIRTAESAIEGIHDIQEGFWDKVSDYLTLAEPELQNIKSIYTSNTEYAVKLCDLLGTKGVPAELSDANIIIGPLDVAIKVQDYSIMLTMGRKKQVITDLEINKVARVIELYYRKLNSSFNANSFFKRLLKAYEFANTRMYSSPKVMFGYGVALKDIFELFTLSPASADYKLENFLWDLGRLCINNNIIDNYQIELGCSRDVKKMYVIKTANGDTLKASTLTLHITPDHENSK